MKILHVVEATATGTLSMMAMLVEAQISAGHSVFVIYSRRPETPHDIAKIISSDAHLIQLQMLTVAERIYAVYKLQNLYKEIAPDTIFLHSSFAGFLGRVAAMLYVENKPIFYLPHCISTMRTDLSRIKKSVFRSLEVLASLKNCEYVACSRSEAIEIKRVVPFRRCHILENAVEVDAIKGDEHSFHHADMLVVTVGQIRDQKDPRRFAEIAKIVRNKLPNVNFMWVGDGEEKAKSQLTDIGVIVTGWTPRTTIFSILSGSSVYLSTSLWEGMPVSIIEAQFAGTPIVASSIPGNIDAVEHGTTGMLFTSTDEAAEQIVYLLLNKDSAKHLTTNALDSAQRRFSKQSYSRRANTILELCG